MENLGEQFVRRGILQAEQASSDGFLNRLVACRASTAVFAKAFCPKWVSGVMTPQRLENFSRLDDDTIPYGGTLATRTFAKTVSTKLWCIKDACYQRLGFLVWASSTLDIAEQETDNIRQELVSNPEIFATFRNMKPVPYNGTNPSFSKAGFYLSNPQTGEPFAFILPRAVNTTCNGLIINIGGKMCRPNRIVLDDGEDRKYVGNEDYRRELREWVHGTLIPCVSDLRPTGRRWTREQVESGETWRVWVQDTYKHNDCMMQHLVTDPAWNIGVYPKVKPIPTDDPKKFRWVTAMPEIYTQAQAEQEMADYEARGMLNRYMKEFGCRGTADMNSCWIQDYFVYYSDAAERINLRGDVLKFGILDPSRSPQPWADYSACGFIGWDTHGGDVLLRKEFCERVDTPDLLDLLLENCIATNTRELWVETTGNEGLPYTIKQHFKRYKRPIRVCTITAKTIPGDWGDGDDARKIALGAQILPWYKAKVKFVKHDHSLRGGFVEGCMMSYPECKFWDPMDWAGYIPLVAKEKKLVMMPILCGDNEEEKLPQFQESGNAERYRELIRSGSYRPVIIPRYGRN